MRHPGSILNAIALLVLIFSDVVSATEPGREFSAEAVGEFGLGGGNRMLVTFVIDRFTSVEEAQQLAGLLERGGQSSLVAALRGRFDGRLRMGALEMPLALVVAEPVDRGGYRYLFLTPRRIQFHEKEFGEESLNYPFGIVEFEVDRFGRGVGNLHLAAALSIDADGHVEIEDYDGADGRIERIKQLR
jgi:hypothetical protein